jgi:hypothetical protein
MDFPERFARNSRRKKDMARLGGYFVGEIHVERDALQVMSAASVSSLM